jgi:hypothetical protein
VNPVALYGKLQSDRVADENLICRQMVREIMNFGITQRQTLMVMYLLAMELENVEQMKELTAAIRDVGGEELFLIGAPETAQEIIGG